MWISKLFNIVLMALPLIVWNGYYEGPKIFLFSIVGFFLTVFWVYKSLIRRQFLVFDKSDKFYLLWLLILITASIFGIHPLESIIGGSYRHQGVLFFFTLWLVYKTVQVFDGKQKSFLSRGIGLVILAEVIIVLLEFVFGKLYFGKPLGTIGEANAVAGFLAIGSYFVIQNFPKIYFIFPLVAIAITQSRSGILAVIPSLANLTNIVSKKIQNMILILISSIVIIGISAITITKSNLPFDTIESRQIIWPAAIGQIIKKPFLGYGAESGEVIFNNAFESRGILMTELIIDRAHNLFLDVAMWSGGVGLIFFAGYLVERYRNLKDKYKKFAFLSFIIFSMFQPLSIVHWLLLFLL
jgi:O-antigen ligase